MQYFVHRAGNNLGPYSLADLQQQVAAGSIKPDELAWHEGLPQWQPVSTLISSPAAVTQPVGIPVTTAPQSAEQTRQLYFSHEQHIRSVGTLYCFLGGSALLGSVLVVIAGILTVTTNGEAHSSFPLVAILVEGIVLAVVCGLYLWAGILLRRLAPTAFVVGIIVAALGLLSFPVGTILNGFILYLLLCEKGRFVLSDTYRQVVAATPNYQWKTALWVKIVIGLIILVFVSIMVISVLLALGQTVRGIQSGQH